MSSSTTSKPPPMESDDLLLSHFKEEREETCLTCMVQLFNPLSYFRVVYGTFAQVAKVCAGFRRLRFMDVLSGLIVGILLTAFGIVFSATIFVEAGLPEYIGAGGNTQAVAIVVGGAMTALFSDVGVTISSPDINPSVFFGNMAVISAKIIRSANRTAPSTQLQQQQIFTTTLAAMIICTTFLGLILYFVGRVRLTRVLQMLPDTVLTGFMASIGYIVIHKGLRTSMPLDVWQGGAMNPQWWTLALPAVGFGMLFYIRMRYELGPPGLIVPLLIAIPIAIFYIVVYATGSNIDKVRAQGWMYPVITYTGPGIDSIYGASYGSAQLVNWLAVANCIPQMILLWIVVVIDVLLKMAAVRKVLNANELRFEHEVMLMGKQNFFGGLLVGAPSYSQPVLASVNQSIVKNKTSRAPGLIAVFFNLALWAVAYPAVNFIPRFWLAGLVFYSAWGFIVDNLIDSAFRLSIKEYLTVWLIVIINGLFGLGWAILCGIVATALIFAVMYGRGGSIKAVNSGADIRSSVIRGPQEERLLTHLGNTVIVVQLHRFMFFGSAVQVMDMVQGLVDAQLDSRQVDRVRYFIFDFSEVEDIDSTAMGVFIEIVKTVMGSTMQEKERDAALDAQLATTKRKKNTTSSTNNDDADDEVVMDSSDDDSDEEDLEKGASSKKKKKLTKKEKLALKEKRKQAKKQKQMMEDTAGRMIVLFTGLSKRLRRNMARERVVRELYDAEFKKIANKVKAASDEDVEAIPELSKRCFANIDLGMEWIEERLLERAHVIRKRWLRFDSFARLHGAARRKAQDEGFDTLMWGGTIPGDEDQSMTAVALDEKRNMRMQEMAKYIETIPVPKGSIIWRAGDFNPQLYVLQSGKLTAIVNRMGTLTRSHTYRRGSFVNEDALYVETPLTNTVVAETDSVVLSLSRENMKKLVLSHPEVAVAIQANVLRYAARTKMVLARSKDASDFYRAARLGRHISRAPAQQQLVRVEDEKDANGEGADGKPITIKAATGSARLAEDLRGLMDVSALSQGVRNGRRIAAQFSNNLMSNMDSAPAAVVKPTARTAAKNAQLAASRSFAQVVRFEDLDERIKTDWSLFVGDGQIARADDVMRVVSGLTSREAREMIWIVDLENRGGVSLFDLLDAITTVWEGEFTEPEIRTSRGPTAKSAAVGAGNKMPEMEDDAGSSEFQIE